MTKDIKAFTVRVYGLLVNDNNELLISKEKFREGYVHKFPGGGIEFGEGSKTALIREFMEEADIEVDVLDHVYTSDFFIQSHFNKTLQVVCVFYLVKPSNPADMYRIKPCDKEVAMQFIWLPLQDNGIVNTLSFEADKRAVQMLKKMQAVY